MSEKKKILPSWLQIIIVVVGLILTNIVTGTAVFYSTKGELQSEINNNKMELEITKNEVSNIKNLVIELKNDTKEIKNMLIDFISNNRNSSSGRK